MRTQREPCVRQANQADNATGCFVTNVKLLLNPSVINYELYETKEVDFFCFVIPNVVYCAALPQKVAYFSFFFTIDNENWFRTL